MEKTNCIVAGSMTKLVESSTPDQKMKGETKKRSCCRFANNFSDGRRRNSNNFSIVDDVGKENKKVDSLSLLVLQSEDKEKGSDFCLMLE